MMVGSGYNNRESCNGQTLASPGRWPIDMRRLSEVGHLECHRDQVQAVL